MSQDPYGQQPPYQPPHPNAPMHPAIQYAPVPTQKPEPTTVVKIGTYLIYAVALYMIMRAIVGLDDFGFQTYHTENGKTTEVNSSTGLGYVISAIFAAFTIFLGFFYSKGHGWARITALVLGIIGTIRDLLYFLLTLLAQSLVQSVTSQMDGAQQVSISPAVYASGAATGRIRVRSPFNSPQNPSLSKDSVRLHKTHRHRTRNHNQTPHRRIPMTGTTMVMGTV